MVDQHRGPYATYEDIVMHYQSCSGARKAVARWLVGLLVVVTLGLWVQFRLETNQVVLDHIAQSEINAGMNEKIKAIDANAALLRSDLQEIKGYLRELVRQNEGAN